MLKSSKDNDSSSCQLHWPRLPGGDDISNFRFQGKRRVGKEEMQQSRRGWESKHLLHVLYVQVLWYVHYICYLQQVRNYHYGPCRNWLGSPGMSQTRQAGLRTIKTANISAGAVFLVQRYEPPSQQPEAIYTRFHSWYISLKYPLPPAHPTVFMSCFSPQVTKQWLEGRIGPWTWGVWPLQWYKKFKPTFKNKQGYTKSRVLLSLLGDWRSLTMDRYSPWQWLACAEWQMPLKTGHMLSNLS